MTRLTPRNRWQKAVASAVFPASQRPVKATLLVLAGLLTPSGELNVWRDEMAQATGLPVRTLNRHLQRAVEDGWLIRDVPGGHGRRSLYRAAIPGSCAPSVAHNLPSCGPSTRTQLPEVVGHPAAQSRKKSASDRERVAVDSHRGRRRTHDGSRASLYVVETKDGSNNGTSRTPAPFSTAGRSVPTTQREAGWSA